MEKTTTLIALEVTEEEMKEVLRRREAAVKEAAIQEKTDQIAQLMKEIEALGGTITAVRDKRNSYFSACGESVIAIRKPYFKHVEIVIT